MSRRVERGTFKRTCRTCGWSGTYDTAAKANHAKRQHSCQRRLDRAAAAERGAARMAAVDRTPKPCLHKVAEHQHGTYACYTLDRCRCAPCVEAVTRYEQNRVRQQAYGRWAPFVDAEPSRQHVRALQAGGMGLKRIAAVSGVPHGQLWKLMTGLRKPDGTQTPSQRVRPSTEQKLLAIALDIADGGRVDSLGAVRRVQSLIALGWSQAKIAVQLGLSPGNFTPIAHGYRAQITAAHDRAVRALYDQLSMSLPPETEWRDKIAASRARNYARANGWLPPLAWDEERIDDPTYTPVQRTEDGRVHDGVDQVAVERVLSGQTVRTTRAEKEEVVRRWRAAGRPLNELERLTGWNPHRYLSADDHQDVAS